MVPRFRARSCRRYSSALAICVHLEYVEVALGAGVDGLAILLGILVEVQEFQDTRVLKPSTQDVGLLVCAGLRHDLLRLLLHRPLFGPVPAVPGCLLFLSTWKAARRDNSASGRESLCQSSRLLWRSRPGRENHDRDAGACRTANVQWVCLSSAV